MNFTQAITSGFQNYVNFSDRVVAFGVLVLDFVCLSWFPIVASTIDYLLFPHMDFSPLQSLVGLALFLPGLAISVRRLHDLDRIWMVGAADFDCDRLA